MRSRHVKSAYMRAGRVEVKKSDFYVKTLGDFGNFKKIQQMTKKRPSESSSNSVKRISKFVVNDQRVGHRKFPGSVYLKLPGPVQKTSPPLGKSKVDSLASLKCSHWY